MYNVHIRYLPPSLHLSGCPLDILCCYYHTPSVYSLPVLPSYPILHQSHPPLFVSPFPPLSSPTSSVVSPFRWSSASPSFCLLGGGGLVVPPWCCSLHSLRLLSLLISCSLVHSLSLAQSTHHTSSPPNTPPPPPPHSALHPSLTPLASM